MTPVPITARLSGRRGSSKMSSLVNTRLRMASTGGGAKGWLPVAIAVRLDESDEAVTLPLHPSHDGMSVDPSLRSGMHTELRRLL